MPRLERIRAVAGQHFAEHGYAGTSMRAVAADVGITISTLLFHCGSKEQLLFDVLVDSMGQLAQGLRAAIDAAGPTWSERLAAAIAFHVRFSAEQAFGTTINRTDMDNLSPEHRARYIALRDDYERQFVDLLRWGIASGEFRPVDPKLTAFAIIGVGLTVGRWYRPEGRLAPEEIAAQYVDLFLHALGAAPAASRSSALATSTPSD
jgi:TetR/AcrR family transcriptional regulator, cholesterol catabolism regulator